MNKQSYKVEVHYTTTGVPNGSLTHQQLLVKAAGEASAIQKVKGTYAQRGYVVCSLVVTDCNLLDEDIVALTDPNW